MTVRGVSSGAKKCAGPIARLMKGMAAGLCLAVLCLPGEGICLQALSETESRNVTATAGLSAALDDTVVYMGSESVKFVTRENRDVYGAYTPAQGYLSFNNISSLVTINNAWYTLDVGTYRRPNETYRVADIAKDGDDYKWLEDDPGRLWGVLGTLQGTPQYWPIPNPPDPDTRPEILSDKYGVIQASINNPIDYFDLTANLGMYGGAGAVRDLSALHVNGIHIPTASLTLYPDSGAGKANINLELRARLTIDEISLKNNSGAADFKASGIHFAESFYPAWSAYPLPSHKKDFGTAAIRDSLQKTSGSDTYCMDTGYDSWMYGGYFLFGNLNQINFDDLKMESDVVNGDQITFSSGRQIYRSSDNTDDRNPLWYNREIEKLGDPVWIEANPIAFNIGIRNSATPNIWNGYSYISLTGGLHGSIRIASLQGLGGSEFGPAAIDGLRVKYLKLEFPGGYQRDFFTKINGFDATFGWHEKGRVLANQQIIVNGETMVLGQKKWLADNAAATPTMPTASADGTLQWLLTPP